jgi:hypothetical protein
MNLPVTNVPTGVSHNGKTLGIQQLHILDMAVGSMPPDGECIIPHRTDELLIKQYTISNGDTTSAIKEAA